MLFVFSGDVQVQEKLFRILILPKVAIRRRFLCVAKSYNFKGDAIVSSCFITRLCLCNPIFLITKSKYVWFSDYSLCCWNVRRSIQVQEKLFKILMCQSYNSKKN